MATPVDPAVLGAVMELIARGRAATRADLARATGWARSTVSQRVDALLGLHLLQEGPLRKADMGRPALRLQINPDAGVVLSADLGATHATFGVADLGATMLAETTLDLHIDVGPRTALDRTLQVWREQLQKVGAGLHQVRAAGIGVPGPVDFATGTVVRPPIMPGWDGFAVPPFIAEQLHVPVLVDNDVNIMALGEHSARGSAPADLLFIKVGTGIGCGLINHGVLHRGATGAAGDIGHIRLPGAPGVVCTCGHTGCLEAIASGSALARRLHDEGFDTVTGRDVLRLAESGNATARRAVRLAGRQIGEVLATLVSFYNPQAIIIGGDLAQSHDDLLAEARSAVYGRALPLATRSLTLEASVLGDRAGVVGGTVLALSHVFSPHGAADLLTTFGRC